MIDPAQCPLCSGDNACAAVKGEAACWCFDVTFVPEFLERIPEAARNKACVCRGCALGKDQAPARSIKPG